MPSCISISTCGECIADFNPLSCSWVKLKHAQVCLDSSYKVLGTATIFNKGHGRLCPPLYFPAFPPEHSSAFPIMITVLLLCVFWSCFVVFLAVKMFCFVRAQGSLFQCRDFRKSKNFSIPNIIRKKRDGQELEDAEIRHVVDCIITPIKEERIHDAQIGAFLMASYLNGLSQNETVSLVKAMTYSGFRFTWPQEWKCTVVDKHSTGGVGDKVSLILAPALAACGMKVPMISGRGLDFTGGTLDKLESIPGFSVSLSKQQFVDILEKVGCCIMGQTSDIAPADKIIYSIRDTTATVDQENLIVASIISKKAAEGLDALVLDVKVGKGAMMKSQAEAESLAEKLVSAGNLFGMKVAAFITNMDDPLGNGVGNSLEVAESIQSLRNEGPQDLLELTCVLGGKLLHMVEKVASLEEGKEEIRRVIKDGSALKKFKDMMTAQGTEAGVADQLCHGDIWKHLPKAEKVVQILSPVTGYVKDIDALGIARLCHKLGCGRTCPGSPVKFEPGVMLLKKPGDKVSVEEALVEVHLPNDSNNGGLLFDQEQVLKMFTFHTEPLLKPLVVKMLQVGCMHFYGNK